MNHKQTITLSIFLLIISTFASAQSVESDSTSILTHARIFIAPIPQIGSLDRCLPSENIIADSVINFSNYRYSGDLLSLKPGIFIRDFSNLGMLPDVTIFGMGFREISFMSDGVSLNDPLTGLYNPFFYPTENIERIELIQGTRSFLYGINSTGGVINFVSKSKKAIKPFSKIRYSESGYGFGIIDGMVSQDIIRGLNVTAGMQHSVFGERYPNENYDCWNGRIKARYNINDKINFFVSEIYNQSLMGLYGGIDIKTTPDSLLYEPLQAIVRNTDAYEKLNRHDIRLGAAMRLFPDSTAITGLTFYFTSNVRRYRDLENQPQSNGIYLDQSFLSKWYGCKLTQNFSIVNNRFDFGADINQQRVMITPAKSESLATSISLYGKTEIPVLPFLNFAAYGRIENYRHQNLFGYGGDISFTPDSSFNIFGGYSRSFRIPTFEETIGTPPTISSTITDNNPERHHLFEIGLRWTHENLITLEVRSFYRTIWNFITTGISDQPQNPDIFTRHQKKIIQGIAGSGTIRYGILYLEGTGQFLESIDHAETGRTFPKWTANSGIYYWDNILNNHLELKVGVNGKFFSDYTSLDFNQQADAFVSSGQQYKILPTGVMDVVILAHIKSAYIHFIWDNILNRHYIMNSFYPMPERQMRFGVSWEFLD